MPSFLQIRVSMAKLQPLLNHCKFFMKCVFVLSFYNALYSRFLYMRHYAWFSQILTQKV